MSISPWMNRNDLINYKDEGKQSKIVGRENFIHNFEKINPLSVKYLPYWREIKRRCIEGYWCQGKWMPGQLYHYINVSKILMNKKNSKTKSVGRPFLRDIEWEKAYVLMEARGFSGFKNDSEYTCNNSVKELEQIVSLEEKERKINEYWRFGLLSSNCFVIKNKKKILKRYVSPRFYLRKIHLKNLGKPLFENNAWNVMDIEARRMGKSYWGANGIIIPNFLYDGATDYDEFIKARDQGEPLSSETLVGAIDSKYTKDLLSKVQLGLDNLGGEFEFDGEKEPSPLSKLYKGTFNKSGDYIEAAYGEKTDSGWVTRGSRSKIHNRTFANNPLAGNGTGPNIVCFEEVGFFANLIDSLGSMKDATYDGTFKFGTIYMFGTGGDMEGGSSEQAREVFYNPASYDCLSFNDIWEESGSIGFFVPYIYRLERFRDEQGIIDQEAATKWSEEKREALKTGESKRALEKEQENNPLVTSEAFLVKGANMFPTTQLKEHLNWLKMQYKLGKINCENGELEYVLDKDGNSDLKWIPDLDNKLTPCKTKMTSADDTTGCIQIFEHPIKDKGVVPSGLYLAGNDPYDQDKAETSTSLGSTFIYKTFYNDIGVSHEIVAEYTARPERAKIHHENVRKLLLYYDARMLYENEKITIKIHFDQKFSTYLLCKKPSAIKSAEESKVDREYGIHMSTPIKKDCEILLNDWLREEYEPGKLNLFKLKSIPLVEELIHYNDVGNFDRVISIMLTILNKTQHYFITPEKVKSASEITDTFFETMSGGGFYQN
jgi:hypothetical protein